jgi:hypothetical protein
MAPGPAVRSIAAEDYRLARDRGASPGRKREEAPIQTLDTWPVMNAQLRRMRIFSRATG